LEITTIEALSKAWAVSLEEVLRISIFHQRDNHIVGKKGDQPFYAEVDLIKNPKV
jgi:hypothetical protein